MILILAVAALAAVVGWWFGRSEVIDPAAAPIPARGERISA